jgi:hypothetical protein
LWGQPRGSSSLLDRTNGKWKFFGSFFSKKNRFLNKEAKASINFPSIRKRHLLPGRRRCILAAQLIL